MSKASSFAVSVVVASLLAGCAGKPGTPSLTNTVHEAESVGTSMSACPTLAANLTLDSNRGAPVITKVCFLDEKGTYYSSGLSDTGGGIPILPGGHHYAIVYEFADGWMPSPAHAASGSSVFTAPEAIPTASTCADFGFPEDDPSNLAAQRVTVQGNTLTESLDNIVADGEQLVSRLDLSKLYACNGECADPSGIDGFTLRAYVAHVPPCGP